MYYGYCRISQKKQNIDRQVRNILEIYPKAYIIKEAYTGTKIYNRKEFERLLKVVKSGDTIIFDSASRMSRNVEEAVKLYEELFTQNVNLVFLKEPHINTEIFKKSLNNQIQLNLQTGNESADNFINGIIDVLNKYTIDLAKEQIKIVFAQAEKEVEDLQQRTIEGIVTAKLNGKKSGRKKGSKLITKKSIATKEIIKKYSRQFDGFLTDEEVIKLANISKNSYYKYKRELRESINSKK